MRHWWNLGCPTDMRRSRGDRGGHLRGDRLQWKLRSEQQRKVTSLVPTEVARAARHQRASRSGTRARTLLFLASVAMRGALALMLVRVRGVRPRLCSAPGAPSPGWCWASPARGLAWVLLDDAFDIEGTLAREAALAAAFDPDPFGARAAAVRAYSDEFVRTHGRAPDGPASLRQPGTDRSFRAYFAVAQPESRSWYAKVLLMSLQRALRSGRRRPPGRDRGAALYCPCG